MQIEILYIPMCFHQRPYVYTMYVFIRSALLSRSSRPKRISLPLFLRTYRTPRIMHFVRLLPAWSSKYSEVCAERPLDSGRNGRMGVKGKGRRVK